MSLSYPGSETLITNPEHPPGSKPLNRPESIVKARSLSYLLWEIVDIEQQREFLTDFGMLDVEHSQENLLMRGYGEFPYLFVAKKGNKHRFLGTGFVVATRAELVALATATGQSIEPIDRPGGGELVRLQDPNGLIVEVCCDIKPAEPIATREQPLVANTPAAKARVNQGQRAPLQPSPVIRIGHCVTAANNLIETSTWYMRHLGLIPSDVLCLDDASPIIAFMRLDCGDQPVDHHCFVVGKGGGKGYLHSAYEVVDLDAVAQGQQFLKAKKYKHVWGIGRHLLGSQLFDYWQDPEGFEFEHYADGDVFTSDYPTSYHPMDTGNVYAWGQDMPKSMLAPNAKQIGAILSGLFDGTVSFSWLKAVLRATKRPARPWL